MKLSLPEKKIVELYNSGSSTLKIAKMFDCSSGAINNLLNRNNIKLRNHGRSIIRLDNNLIAEMYKNGKDSNNIAKEFNCSPQTILNRLKEMNIKIKETKLKKGLIPKWTLNLPEEEIIRMYSIDKLSPRKISLIFKCSQHPIIDILKKNKITPHKIKDYVDVNREIFKEKGRIQKIKNKNKNLDKIKLDLNYLRMLYLEKDLSLNQISKMFNCSDNVIKRRLIKLGIKIRGLKEVTLRKKTSKYKNSKPEVKIQEFCKNLKLDFFTHQYMKITNGYECDILIPSLNLVIECDGDFIHCNPQKYSENYIRFPKSGDRRTAKMIWEIDKIRTEQLREKGYNVLRLWQSEINNLTLPQFKSILKIYKKKKVIVTT